MHGDCLTALRPFGKGRQSGGCSPTAQAYPLREDGYPSAEKPFAPRGSRRLKRVLLILFRASIILCSVAFIIFIFRTLSTLCAHDGAILSLLRGFSAARGRVSVQKMNKTGGFCAERA